MDKPMAKRVYTPPKIIRVELNPEQAVLSQCSILSTALLNNVLTDCDDPTAGGLNCRKSSAGLSPDAAPTS